MKENISENPFIVPELTETKIIQEYWTDLFNAISSKRSWISEALIYDLIIKAIRRIICESKDCNNCNNCNPSLFMTKERIKYELKNNQQLILKLITEWLNNSYNIPERWMIFLSVFDELFQWSENIVVCEIWCGWWLIWKVLTNSNYSREYFKEEYSHIIKKDKDNFKIQYYWLDPNLSKDKKDILMNINWDTEYAQKARQKIEQFFNDDVFKQNNLLLENNTLSENSIPWIKKKILLMLGDKWINDSEFAIITSVVRYHFNNSLDDDYFVNMIKKLLHEVYIETGIQWYYISKEIYWDDWKVYPSRNSIPSKFLVNYSVISKDWNLSNEINIPYLSHNL